MLPLSLLLKASLATEERLLLKRLGGPPNLIGIPLAHVPGVIGEDIGLLAVDARPGFPPGGEDTIPRPSGLLAATTGLGALEVVAVTGLKMGFVFGAGVAGAGLTEGDWDWRRGRLEYGDLELANGVVAGCGRMGVSDTGESSTCSS